MGGPHLGWSARARRGERAAHTGIRPHLGWGAARRGERAHLAVADCLEGRHAAQQQQVDFTQRMPMCEYLWHTGVGIREALRGLIREAISADDGGHQRSSERHLLDLDLEDTLESAEEELDPLVLIGHRAEHLAHEIGGLAVR